jgi:hypothetical protein
VWWLRLREPLLCRLGFHKWQDYGKQVEVFWEEPPPLNLGIRGRPGAPVWSPKNPKSNVETHSKVVHQGHECARCGMKLRRKLVTNSDGTLSSIGWEPDTEETHKD